ncbi:MAG: DNA helicase II [Pseudomonadota bacterium]
MDVSHILDGLNDPQRQAVTASEQHQLVLAGAGSGKTRVLVHRIAWLIEVEHVASWNILAVTFTNKAAREMRSRIEELISSPTGAMWVGTFHGLAHRLLRSHWQEAGLIQGFQIMDSDDQLRLIKRILKSLDLDDSRWPPRQVQWFINAHKDEGRRPQHIDDSDDFFHKQMIRIYQEYEEACQRGGVVDFAELLLRSHELLRDNPQLLDHYRKRFTHILADEFQDTNSIQYAWIRLLVGTHNQLFVVGDDDQSIYGWRGARVENIQNFQRDFPGARLIKLEQNYRSSGNILQAANAIIAHNPSRLGKSLWTEDDEGEPIYIFAAFNEVDEARFITEQIVEHIKQGKRRTEIAILYRTSAQSRLFEEALLQSGIPYRVYGGMRFFERAEVKDALAYVRLISNPHDDVAFERAVNQPPRGIGPRTLDAVRQHARDFSCSLWQASTELHQGGTMQARAANALQRFNDLITGSSSGETEEELSLGETLSRAINNSGLRDHFKKSRDGKGQDRIENLDELVTAAQQFINQEDELLSDLEAFLAHASLEAGENQAQAYEDCIQLMTLHSAKGLEFPVVYIGGVEEGLFPHRMSAEDPDKLEEERRLCYVGMTRAMQQLTLSHAESRRLHGSENYPLPSRFLREIPPQHLHEIRSKPQITRPYTPSSHTPGPDEGLYHLGQKVRHPKFGEGVILNSEGEGASARVQINFESEGVKWLVVNYANLS